MLVGGSDLFTLRKPQAAAQLKTTPQKLETNAGQNVKPHVECKIWNICTRIQSQASSQVESSLDEQNTKADSYAEWCTPYSSIFLQMLRGSGCSSTLSSC